MSEKKRRIAVLTSGGDCPGLNAVIRGVVSSAAKLGWEVIGFIDGFEGILPFPEPRYVILDEKETANIMKLGGTILGTTNKGHFVAKVGKGDKVAIPPDILEKALGVLRDLEISAIVVIGGDGSLSTALQLHENGVPVVGVPKTIDNDLESTAMTFGFDSAVACVTDSLDRLHTTADSHRRVIVLEVMGRHAGWIALYGGFAGGADAILIPEIPFNLDKVAAHIKKRDAEGWKSSMVVVAEGAKPADGEQIRHETQSGEYRLGGIGDYVGREIARRTEKEVRTCVLGHLQRGGVPTTLDRILGTRFGLWAVKLIKEGKYGSMVSYQNYEMRDVPIAAAVHKLRHVSPNGQFVEAARSVDICFGD
jgi:phosphofructokinase-like protein